MIFGDLPNITTPTPPPPDATDDSPNAPSPQPPAHPTAPPPAPSRPGAPVHHPVWLGYAASLIVVPRGSQERVQLRGLTLLELGQGPGMKAGVSGVDDVNVWTHLVWAVNRWVRAGLDGWAVGRCGRGGVRESV